MLAKRNYLTVIFLLLTTFICCGNKSRFLTTNAQTNQFTSNFKDAAWFNSAGVAITEIDYKEAPFSVNDQGQSFYFSCGAKNTDGDPRLGSWNAATSVYHKLTGPLANLNSVSSATYKAAIVTKQYLENIKVSNIAFSWSGSKQGEQNVSLVYSLDEGQHWQVKQTEATNSNNLISFNMTLKGNRLLFGIMAGHSIANTYNFISPQLSYEYEPLDEQETMTTFAETIMQYTPCLSDEDDMVFANETIAESLKEQYEEFTIEQQTYFASLDEGQYQQRLNFITGKYPPILNQISNSGKATNNKSLFYILILGMVFLYGAIRKKEAQNR